MNAYKAGKMFLVRSVLGFGTCASPPLTAEELHELEPLTLVAPASKASARVAISSPAGTEGSNIPAPQTIDKADHPYIGMWFTKDGHVRQELLPNGRYDEARGTKASAYQGRYVVRGNRIDYWDDTGFTADGVFVSGDELHHGGMTFYRQL